LQRYLLGTDNSMRSMGGCQLYRPDKLYASGNLVIHTECDEFEHKKSNGDYQCDEKRISDIYDEFCGKTYVVIRWNPDSYKTRNGEKKLNRQERLDALVSVFKKLREKEHKDPIHIYYMFYSKDNERITKNFPYTLLYSDNL
jgi:hypothetical protein